MNYKELKAELKRKNALIERYESMLNDKNKLIELQEQEYNKLLHEYTEATHSKNNVIFKLTELLGVAPVQTRTDKRNTPQNRPEYRHGNGDGKQQGIVIKFY